MRGLNTGKPTPASLNRTLLTKRTGVASLYGVRMPSAYVPGSELRLLRRAAKRAGISGADMRDAFGGGVAHLHELNPHWPAFALIGLILEIAAEKAAA